MEYQCANCRHIYDHAQLKVNHHGDWLCRDEDGCNSRMVWPRITTYGAYQAALTEIQRYMMSQNVEHLDILLPMFEPPPLTDEELASATPDQAHCLTLALKLKAEERRALVLSLLEVVQSERAR